MTPSTFNQAKVVQSESNQAGFPDKEPHRALYETGSAVVVEARQEHDNLN